MSNQITINEKWVVAPLALLDAPMRTKEFLKTDADGNPLDASLRESFMSVREYCEANPIKQWTELGTDYFSFGHALNFMDIVTAKEFVDANAASGISFIQCSDPFGLEYTDADLQSVQGGVVAILGQAEMTRLKQVNPKFMQDEVA